MQLYIFTFDNGQVMLIELTPDEVTLSTDVITDKIRKAHEWAESRFGDSGISYQADRPDSMKVFKSGAVIDCSRLMAFGPYVELPKEEGV